MYSKRFEFGFDVKALNN